MSGRTTSYLRQVQTLQQRLRQILLMLFILGPYKPVLPAHTKKTLNRFHTDVPTGALCSFYLFLFALDRRDIVVWFRFN